MKLLRIAMPAGVLCPDGFFSVQGCTGDSDAPELVRLSKDDANRRSTAY